MADIAAAPAAPAAPTRTVRLAESRLSGFVLVVALLLLWEISARLGWVMSQNWPPFSAILVQTVRGLLSGELSGILAASLGRMFAGYAIGAVLGIAAGLLLGTIPVLYRLANPLAETLRPMPIPAIVPPLILFLGLENALKITVVTFAVFFPMLVSTVGGIRSVDEVLVRTGRTFGTPRGRLLLRVVLPAAAPSVLAGLRLTLSLALVTTIVAEMIAGSSGIGYYVVLTQYAMRPTEMYSAVLCLAVTGYLLNRAVVIIERRCLVWYAREGR